MAKSCGALEHGGLSALDPSTPLESIPVRDRRPMRQAVICAPVRTPAGRYGLETMCIGGGQGLAAVFERAA